MKPTQATIKDIARELGIAPSTVSRALHDHPAISIETKKQVLECAQRLDYQPNLIAFNLKKRQSNTVGIVVPDLAHHYFAAIISGVQEVLYKNGYNLLICQSNEDAAREAAVIETLLSNRIDGLLVSVAKTTKDSSHFKKVLSRNMPLVFFDRTFNELDTEVPGVWVNDAWGAKTAVKQLIEKGCKRIASIVAPLSLNIGRERLRGFKEALEEANLPYDPTLVFETDLTVDDAQRISQTIFSLKPAVDAVFIASGISTKTFITEAMRQSKKLKICGFMNDLYPGHVEKDIIRVVTPTMDMGRTAAKTLLDLINDTNNEPKSTMLQPSIRVE